MRFLHTSDLHIGKRVNGFSLLGDQEKILEQIAALAVSENCDGILLAGDIYDRPSPSGEAVALFDKFLCRLAAAGIQVFAISGNHDSPERVAYLGDLLGLEYIYQSIAVPQTRILVQNAMLESAMALHKKYGADLMALQLHITDLLGRFTNAALGDTCQRVGGDPARKLSANDRLIGSSLLALEQGITPAYITVGAAAGMRRYLAENGQEQTVENALAVLQEVSQLAADAPLTKLILDRYEEICNGATLDALCAKAEAVKTASLHQVV